MNYHILFFRFLPIYVFCVYGGWIDPDTDPLHYTISSLTHFPSNPTKEQTKSTHKIVFSDEFNVENRNFHDGYDPRWTAISKDDYTNYALQFYNSSLVSTSSGYLNISTVIHDIKYSVNDPKLAKPYTKTKNYQSAMIQGWNKFCFTGGIVKVRAKLPGKWNVGGLWPAMWLLGNLARATYVGSSNNMWPWSFKECSSELQHQQLISGCNKVNHFGMQPGIGRGAPEIDILEAMAGDETLINTPIHRPYYSSSYQVSPAIEYRPNNAEPPDLSQWYEHGLEYGENTSLNIFFYGMHLEGSTKDASYTSDAISANRNLYAEHFEEFHEYQFEWVVGENGYLAWYLDGEFVYRIDAKALNKTGAILPEEPMYLIFNTAMSSTWGFPQPCPEGCPCDCFDCRLPECLCATPPNMCQNFPAHFLIDYVRVYQNEDDPTQIVGCSTPSHPTKKFIQAHESVYKESKDQQPLLPVARGGGKCRKDEDCGVSGTCNVHKKSCSCHGNMYTGPNCQAALGFDDINWEKDQDLGFSWALIPKSLVMLVLLLFVSLVVVVLYQYRGILKEKERAKFYEIEYSKIGGEGESLLRSKNTNTNSYSHSSYQQMS